MIEHILRQFAWEYANITEWELAPEVVAYAGVLFSNALARQFGKRDDRFRIRLSSLGYPTVYQLLPLYGFMNKRELNLETRKIFMRGELLEIYLLVLLKAFLPALKIEHNPDVTYLGYSGHPDLVLSYQGERCIVECKSVSKHYAKQFLARPDNERGYLTQLLMYLHALDIPRGYFLMEVQETNELYMVGVSVGDYQEELAEALAKLALLDKFNKERPDLLEALRQVEIPEPVPAFIKRNTFVFPTTPPELRYMEDRKCLYHLEPVEGSTRPRVIDKRTPEEIIECLTKTTTD